MVIFLSVYIYNQTYISHAPIGSYYQLTKKCFLVFFISTERDFLSATGIPIDKVAHLNQEVRDYVGKKLLEVTLLELFVFRFMQACLFSL